MSSYAELHCLSNFTFLRGASHPGELVAQAAALGYSALALTDECSMAGVVRAHDAAKERRLKLIVGSEFRTLDDLHVVLLAPTQTAYAEICALITRARLAADKGAYRLSRADFQSQLDHCLAIWVPSAEPRAGTAGWMRELFPGRCWIAVELHLGADDPRRLARLRQLGAAHGLPLVAAGDVHMHSPERRALQDTLTAIRHRCTLAAAGHRLFPNGERHLRSYEQLRKIYPRELLDETLHIAQRCEFSLDELRYRYPRELVPPGIEPSEHLRNLTEAGLKWRWPEGISEKIRAVVDKELALIKKLQYEHFFLTVHEIVEWARGRPKPILCQGRGSAANSVVCYALRITEVDPRNIAALFERFISAERNEPPDIDVDFEHERREEVIQHVFEKYGRERAALAATVITYRPKSAIRDVGKALGLDPDVIDRLAKMQAYWDNWEAFRNSIASQGLQLDADVIRRLCALVKELLNFPRHLSQHVGGFVIAQDRVSDLVPIENAAMPERQVIQWDKTDLESLGLLKVDVLALGMLTALQQTFDLLARAGTGPTNMEQIPREDSETYDMICNADTIGVFQIESRAQMSMLPRLQAAQLLRSGHRDRDRAPRADQGRHGASLSAATTYVARGSALSERGAQASAGEDARRADFPGAGHADRRRRRGLLARRGGSAAARDGRLAAQRQDGHLPAEAHGRHARQWLLGNVRRADLQADRRLRRVRLPGIAFGVVRIADVCFELAQIPSPRRVFCRPHQQPADGVLSAGAVAGAGQAATRADPAGGRHCERVSSARSSVLQKESRFGLECGWLKDCEMTKHSESSLRAKSGLSLQWRR